MFAKKIFFNPVEVEGNIEKNGEEKCERKSERQTSMSQVLIMCIKISWKSC